MESFGLKPSEKTGYKKMIDVEEGEGKKES
jgi:hypothetical protein